MRTATLIVVLLVVLAGCISRAGPYVTALDIQGRTLLVERCYWQWDRFTGALGNADCSRTSIPLDR